MIDYGVAKAWTSGEIRHSYSRRDTILYALGVGFGADPLDERELRFVYEDRDLQATPSMACVLASPGIWMRDHPTLGLDFARLLHGEQRLHLHAPIPVEGTVIGVSRVARLVDKGVDKGALMYIEKQLFDEPTGDLLATTEQILFLRGDGGFAAAGRGSDPAEARADATPDSAAVHGPRRRHDLPTRADQALLYRLSGDLNALHADPAVAARAGFPRPILHGLATFGIACRMIVTTQCNGEPSALTGLQARFARPVYPGETLSFDCWSPSPGELRFTCRAVERDVVVLDNGRAAWVSAAR